MSAPAPATSVDEVLALVEEWGAHRYDESVAQGDHARQVAALALRDGAGDAVVAAALLHDVGHLLALRDAVPVDALEPHEVTGPAWLGRLFPAAVTGPIAGHVAAKRYLCAVDPAYLAILSPGSTRSLRRQGGPMPGDEVRAFEATDGWRDAVALRRWDDAGKVDGLGVPRLDELAPVLHAVARPPRSA